MKIFVQKIQPTIKILLFFLLGCFYSSNIFSQSKALADRYINAYKRYLNAKCPVESSEIMHFVYFARDREAIHNHPFLKIARFRGAQIMYSWKQLEPEEGKYDFSIIQEDYEYLRTYGKKLFVQIQDATFSPDYVGIPGYLLTTEYEGGAVSQMNDKNEPAGWVAKRWNPKVQIRFALLLKTLGDEFDGKIEGVNLQETAIGVNQENDSSFSPEIYVNSIKANMLALKKAFPLSVTMQYANFMPGEWRPWNDKGYLRSIYLYGEEIGVGLGGPDLMVQQRGQLNHTIAMMHEGSFTVPLGIAIQDGNYIGQTNSDRVLHKRDNLVPLLHAFAKDFLKVKYMFWVNQEPYFTEDVIPCFNSD